MQSVQAQTIPCHHLIVSDGVPRYFDAKIYESYAANGHCLTVIRLPFGLANSGAGPRALGAAVAFSMGAVRVSFLDADNAILPTHAQGVAEADDGRVSAITVQRRVFLKDTNEETPIEPVENSGQHVDTNCLTLTRNASQLLSLWLFWPTAFGTGEDRIFSAILNAEQHAIARSPNRTVLYWSEWPIHYQLAGKSVPKTAKRPVRRAATHFHADSFFKVVGDFAIADQWRQITTEPLPPLLGGPLVCQVLSMKQDNPNSRLGQPPLAFTDLFLALRDCRGDEQPALVNTNQRLYTLPSCCTLAHLFAHAMVFAYHRGHKTIIFTLESAIDRSYGADAILRKAALGMRGKGVAVMYSSDIDRTPIGVIASPRLGRLVATLACTELNSDTPPDTHSDTLEQRFVTALLDTCRLLHIPTTTAKVF